MNLPTLTAFLKKSRPPNSYVLFPGFEELYVRKFVRHGFPTIDIANVTALKPGNGAFTFLVRHIRERYPDRGIFVESVLNERFEGKLRAMGFECTNPGFGPGKGSCFFLSPLMELK